MSKLVSLTPVALQDKDGTTIGYPPGTVFDSVGIVLPENYGDHSNAIIDMMTALQNGSKQVCFDLEQPEKLEVDRFTLTIDFLIDSEGNVGGSIAYVLPENVSKRVVAEYINIQSFQFMAEYAEENMCKDAE